MRAVTYLVYGAVYYAVAQRLPASTAPLGKVWKWIRLSVCRHLLARCGTDCNIEKGASFGSGRRVSIGDRSGIGIDCRLMGEVSLGSDVMMGPEVIVVTQNHHFRELDIPMIEQGLTPIDPVTVGDDVWIGARAIILPGIRIGTGAIVGAGAVVTRDVAEFAIVAGNPARVIGSRAVRDVRGTEG